MYISWQIQLTIPILEYRQSPSYPRCSPLKGHGDIVSKFFYVLLQLICTVDSLRSHIHLTIFTYDFYVHVHPGAALIFHRHHVRLWIFCEVNHIRTELHRQARAWRESYPDSIDLQNSMREAVELGGVAGSGRRNTFAEYTARI